jgi:epoxide hydrolase-like predicted phosphatase
VSEAPPLRALIVDYGGVLTSSLPAAMAAWCAADGIDPAAFGAVMREWLTPGAERNPVHDLETGALPGADFERRLAATLATRAGVDVPAVGLLTRMFAAFTEEPGMFDALRRARRHGLRTALLSNSWANEYPRATWDGVFDVEVISGQVGLRKPDPAIYLLCAERLGVAPHECVFVDDLRPNVRGAVAVGMVGVLHEDAATTTGELAALFGWPAP